MQRRSSLKFFSASLISLTFGLLKPVSAWAKWNHAAFTATDYDVALNSYFPDTKIIQSDQIKIGVHAVVENGAVVPVKVDTDLNDLQSITVFVDKNPNPLIANFDLAPECLGFVSTRIKMDQPSNIIAVVKTANGVYMNKTFVEVQEGGCG